MKDALKAHFGTLGGYLKLRVQRPGAVKVPGIATHELNHPVNLAFFAGNHHPARQMRGLHAFDHLVTVSIKLRGIDVPVRIKKFNWHVLSGRSLVPGVEGIDFGGKALGNGLAPEFQGGREKPVVNCPGFRQDRHVSGLPVAREITRHGLNPL